MKETGAMMGKNSMKKIGILAQSYQIPNFKVTGLTILDRRTESFSIYIPCYEKN